MLPVAGHAHHANDNAHAQAATRRGTVEPGLAWGVGLGPVSEVCELQAALISEP
jgi:hypothetical protein